MKINNVQIEHFGKLENYFLDFENGFNIIYGNNEDGKSTIMAFIKLMFYGTPGRSTDLSKNMRKKYMPWDGAKMSGSIEFEDKGVTYRLEKQFGGSNATDRISLWNKATGEKEGIASGTDLGQKFFGIGAAAFEKSVFIGQAGSMADTTDREDEITQKLLNLVSTGDESVSQKKVENRLKNAMEALKSRSGRIGVLDKRYQEMNRLNEARSVAMEEEEKKKQFEQQRAVLAEQKDMLEQTYSQQQSQYDLQEKLGRLETLKKLIQKKQGVDSLVAECEDRKRRLTEGDAVFDAVFVKSCEDQILQIQSLEEIYTERKRNVHALEEEDISLKEQDIPEISQEAVEQLKAQEKELTGVRASIIALKESIREFTEASKKQAELSEIQVLLSAQAAEKSKQERALIDSNAELQAARQSLSEHKEALENRKQELNQLRRLQDDANTEYQVAVHNKKSVEQLSNQKIETAREQLKQASAPKQVVMNENAGRSVNTPLLVGAVLLLALSIVLGIVVHPICYVGAVAAIVLGITAFAKTKTRSVTTTIVDEAESVRATANFENVQRAAELDNEDALEAEKRADAKAQELKTKFELLQKSAVEWEQLYQTALAQMSHTEQKVNELEISLRFTNEKLNDLTQKAKAKQEEADGLNVAVEETDIHHLQEQLSVKTEHEAALVKEIQTQLSIKGCETIDELQNQFMQMQNHRTKTAAKAESLGKAREDEKQASENLNTAVRKFISLINQYKPCSSYESAIGSLHELKEAIKQINTLQVKINSQSEFLNEETQGRTAAQIVGEAAEIRDQILSANDGVMPEIAEDWKNEQLKQQSQNSSIQLQEVREAFIKLNSNIKNQFIGKKNVSEIEEEIDQLKKEIAESESDYECLTIAQSTLTEAFTEIRQSFGPLLNDKTAAIFNSLTGGKYHNVIISINFDINVQEGQSAVSHEWQYLSSGTIDQAYLSLRLAVADLLSQESDGLPLMLDDVFLQYDDSRAEQGLRFLVNFVKREEAPTQIILFTCHKSILEWAQKNNMDAVIKTIC